MSSSISPYRLKKGKQYIIKHNDTGKLYKGTFDFMTSIMIIMKNGDKKIQFMYDDDFYDVDDIREKSRKAKQAMEQRALNKILKKIVNENFEW
jgi:hypothetical protein